MGIYREMFEFKRVSEETNLLAELSQVIDVRQTLDRGFVCSVVENKSLWSTIPTHIVNISAINLTDDIQGHKHLNRLHNQSQHKSQINYRRSISKLFKLSLDKDISHLGWNTIKSTRRDDRDALFFGFLGIFEKHLLHKLGFAVNIDVMRLSFQTRLDDGFTPVSEL